jgi:hypothetical protein
MPTTSHMDLSTSLDFGLRDDSSCLDRGMRLPNINDDMTGDGPDLGAMERGTVQPVYGPIDQGVNP